MLRRLSSPSLTGFFLVLVVLAWVLFLPVQFGGSAAYVIINGESMEPLYHRGDLVIIRKEAAYGAGDVVTYFSASLNRHVIHRIVAFHGDEFTLKGDNNDWLDDEKPTAEQIVGKAWIHIPSMGRWLAPLQTPLGLSLVVGAAALLTVLAFTPANKARFLRRRRAQAGNQQTGSFLSIVSTGGAAMKGIARQLESTLFILAIVFVLFLALGIVSFTRDEYLSENITVEYIHLGRFNYSAASQPGVYDSGSAATGDPIFLKTSCILDLRFNYSLMSAAAQEVSGDIALRAQVEANNGWKRSFPLVSKTVFSGNEASVQADLNVCELITSLREIESKTELRRDVYSLVIIPEVNLAATILGQPVTSSFAPRLLFYFDDLQMYILRENAEEDPLLPFKLEEIATDSRIQNSIRLPGFSITVGLARIVSILGLLAVAVAGIFLGVSMSQALKKDPLAAIEVKYGGMIIDVVEFNPGAASREVRVNSIDDLARLAERSGAVILRAPGENSHEFAVELENTLYRYSLPKGSTHVAA